MNISISSSLFTRTFESASSFVATIFHPHFNVTFSLQSYFQSQNALARVSYNTLRDRTCWVAEALEDGDITVNLLGGGKAKIRQQLVQTPV